MAVLNIRLYPDACLKQVANSVEYFNDELQSSVSNLIETMQNAPGCVGIAAPQLGISQRIIIIDASQRKGVKHHGMQVLINPEIISWDSYVIGREGCLSVPDFTGNVMRAETVIVEALSAGGQLQKFEFEDFEARVVQHEIDHLDGLLFLDRLVSRRSDLFVRKNYKGKN